MSKRLDDISRILKCESIERKLLKEGKNSAKEEFHSDELTDENRIEILFDLYCELTLSSNKLFNKLQTQLNMLNSSELL